VEVAELKNIAVTSLDDFEVLDRSGLPRSVEVLTAVIGLIIATPVLLLIGFAIALQSRGPVIFQQQRTGLGGRKFVLYKFRTMICGSEGPEVTRTGDERITWLGAYLRRAKLDELPELWNVLLGDMSLVGPRPEVPRYVNPADRLWQQVLRVRPGLTHPVTLKLRDEETLLAALSGDPEHSYLEILLPYKLKGYLAYQRDRNWWRDVKVIWRTGLVIVFLRTTRMANLKEISRELAMSQLPSEQDKDAELG
jgi:lipopolysaccharide/colanic/teichoic acid biosynthesis glycosyltransferase